MGMKNKHLEHPEDSIFTSGRKGLHTILNFLQEKKSNITVKYDGAPAIVWGVNPDNNRFFVGTKSVFNKVQVKINYNHNDIEVNHVMCHQLHQYFICVLRTYQESEVYISVTLLDMVVQKNTIQILLLTSFIHQS